MTGAVMISWGAGVPGREAKGLEVFGKALAHYDDLAKQGRIHGHREYFALTGNVGERGGFMVIDGELDELLKIQIEPDTIKLLTEADAIVSNFTVTICAGGTESAVQEQVGMFTEALSGLGYM